MGIGRRIESAVALQAALHDLVKRGLVSSIPPLSLPVAPTVRGPDRAVSMTRLSRDWPEFPGPHGIENYLRRANPHDNALTHGSVYMSTTDVLQHKAAVTDIHTGIEKADRRVLAAGVGRALAETYVLYLKTQGVHWNVVGPLFYQIHKLTEEQYLDLAQAVDELAERIRALGFPAPASFSQFTALSAIKENAEIPNAHDAIAMLVADHEMICRTFRQAAAVADDCDDIVTTDILV